VTLQELRIEMSYPADGESEALLRRWAEQALPAPAASAGARGLIR
jgi:hypothetical protein